ncbi:hypothetical protein [Actinokineospora iranica]|nr:hypothetical protein [Actinokineospora iranica]
MFAPGRLPELVRAPRMDASFLTESDREAGLRSVRLVACSNETAQEIRE